MESPRDRLAQLIAPFDPDRFWSQVVGRRPLALTGDGRSDRAQLLGPDPEAAILAAFADHSARLTSHAEGATAPAPAPRAATGAEDYRALVREFHAGGHTVRIPDAGRLSAPLAELLRALTAITGNPADVVVFWSAAGNAAPVHYDDVDVLAIQLAGTKRWYLSKEPPSLVARTRPAADGQPRLGESDEVDVAPGDLLYLPRGTVHTVRSLEESIHLSIGFLPLSVRDGLVALVDHLADVDRSVRENAFARADGSGAAPTMLADHLRRLAEAARDPRIVALALERHRARTLLALPKLPLGDPSAIAPDRRVVRAPMASESLVATADTLDFTIPGRSILVHPAAEPALRALAQGQAIAARDLPGPLDEEARLALVRRLVEAGYLIPAD